MKRREFFLFTCAQRFCFIRYEFIIITLPPPYTAPNIETMAADLIIAADKYQLERLKIMCEEALTYQLSVDNVAETLMLADLHSAKQLKHHCIEFIIAHATETIESAGWAQLERVPKLVTETMRALANQQLPSGSGEPPKKRCKHS